MRFTHVLLALAFMAVSFLIQPLLVPVVGEMLAAPMAMVAAGLLTVAAVEGAVLLGFSQVAASAVDFLLSVGLGAILFTAMMFLSPVEVALACIIMASTMTLFSYHIGSGSSGDKRPAIRERLRKLTDNFIAGDGWVDSRSPGHTAA